MQNNSVYVVQRTPASATVALVFGILSFLGFGFIGSFLVAIIAGLAFRGLDVQAEDGRFGRDILRQSKQGSRFGEQRWMTLWLAEVLE